MIELDLIRRQLQSDDELVKLAALEEIANQSQVRGLTLSVLEAVSSDNSEVQDWALEAIKRSIVPLPEEVATLGNLMVRSDHSMQIESIALMLGRIGSVPETDPETAAVLLETLQRVQSLSARERIVWALAQLGLAQLGSAASVAEVVLQQTLVDAPPRLKRLATETLRRLSAA